MDQDRLEQLIEYIKHHANEQGEVLIIDDFYDSYAISYAEGKFTLINFSPRENAVYSVEEISPESAFGYVQKNMGRA